jgi:N-acetylglucosaminyldiphosphoundecaprenol N-acetyl-beta-D-mannosaminyltransferase
VVNHLDQGSCSSSTDIVGPVVSLEKQRISDPAEFPNPSTSLRSVSILGIPISLVTIETAVDTIIGWTEKRQAEYVCVRDVHGVKLAAQDTQFMKIHHNAGMVTPDGMPLVLLSKLRSQLRCGRVCGSDLLDAVCRAGEAKGLRHYFYGGKPGIPETLICKLKEKYPLLNVAGFYSPPFRPLTVEEDDAIVARIKATGAQIVWVGLSTPKQEFWMRDHVGRIEGATLMGVGAAFDFHSGAVTRAPKWMQNSGLEWLHRLISEPRRLWRRYLIAIPWFLACITREQIGFYFSRRSDCHK